MVNDLIIENFSTTTTTSTTRTTRTTTTATTSTTWTPSWATFTTTTSTTTRTTSWTTTWTTTTYYNDDDEGTKITKELPKTDHMNDQRVAINQNFQFFGWRAKNNNHLNETGTKKLVIQDPSLKI